MGFWDRIKQSVGEIVDEISVDDRVPGLLDRAQTALAAGALDDARTALDQAARLDPKYAPTWRLIGLCALERGEAEQAVTALERADALKARDFSTHLALGRARLETGDVGQALKEAKAALQCPVDERLLEQLYGLLGEIYLARGEIDRAVRELRKAAALAGGKDLQILGLLGRALYLDGNLSMARQSLSRAVSGESPDPEVLGLFVEVLLAIDVNDEAEAQARRLSDRRGGRPTDRLLLARTLLAQGRPGEAREEALRALEGGKRAEAHQLLAEIHLAVDDQAAALTQLEIARQQYASPPPALLRRALLLRVELEADEGLAADAAALLAADPASALALACLGLAQDDDRRALDYFARSLAAEEHFLARLGLGERYLRRGDFLSAETALRAALRLAPTSERCRRRFAEWARKRAGLSLGDDADFYPTLRRAQTFLAERPQLTALGSAAARIQQDFDRPLLVAVMGEFNSGKSTFVNALIGEEIAPMGVTPTTATINVLKYGEERIARVIWRDDREQTFSWPDVGAFLADLDDAEARRVRVVELLFPAEELLRFNVVDTPGLNSMIDEHEETAREYLELADAVIWLFSADQAGKQTEQEALDFIRKQRLKTVGVINKADRVDATELAQVHAHLEEGFSDLVEALIPVSARDALAALVAGDETALGASRFNELRDYLEQRIFSRSRKIKKEAGRRKLADVVRQAMGRVEASAAPLGNARAQLADVLRSLRAATVDPRTVQRRHLRGAIDDAYRQAAQEVLDFVRPRGWRFGEHRASRADRDFLLELLGDRLHRASAASHRRVLEAFDAEMARASDTLSACLGGHERSGLDRHLDGFSELLRQQRALLAQQVYARFDAYARGFLAGGRVDHFFETQLPKIELELEPIHRALTEGSIDFERELLGPLALWRAEGDAKRLAFIESVEREIATLELDLLAGTFEPLRELLDWLDAMGDGEPSC